MTSGGFRIVSNTLIITATDLAHVYYFHAHKLTVKREILLDFKPTLNVAMSKNIAIDNNPRSAQHHIVQAYLGDEGSCDRYGVYWRPIGSPIWAMGFLKEPIIRPLKSKTAEIRHVDSPPS